MQNLSKDVEVNPLVRIINVVNKIDLMCTSDIDNMRRTDDKELNWNLISCTTSVGIESLLNRIAQEVRNLSAKDASDAFLTERHCVLLDKICHEIDNAQEAGNLDASIRAHS